MSTHGRHFSVYHWGNTRGCLGSQMDIGIPTNNGYYAWHMNTNPNAISVLCFGDSNTWGARPDNYYLRFAPHERWTGILQSRLGEGYYIIEEGLGGRTVERDPKKEMYNGKAYFTPCLWTHDPNIIVFMLGTNDVKVRNRRTAKDIARAIEEIFEELKEAYTKDNSPFPKIIIVSPILANETQLLKEWYSDFDAIAIAETQKFAAEIETMAQRNGYHFFDASTVAEPGEDGLHMTKESHKRLGEELAEVVSRMSRK
jgi:lysophospholipase L1-like esterase